MKNANIQFGNSIEADFELSTWTFEMDKNYEVWKDKFAIMTKQTYDELLNALKDSYLVLESLAKFPENDTKGLWDNDKSIMRYVNVNNALFKATGSDIYKPENAFNTTIQNHINQQ